MARDGRRRFLMVAVYWLGIGADGLWTAEDQAKQLGSEFKEKGAMVPCRTQSY
jgi:hypothetical protein